MTPLIFLALYAAALAVAVVVIWLWGVISDRLHARRMVKKFDLFVANLRAAESRNREETR